MYKKQSVKVKSRGFYFLAGCGDFQASQASCFPLFTVSMLSYANQILSVASHYRLAHPDYESSLLQLLFMLLFRQTFIQEAAV